MEIRKNTPQKFNIITAAFFSTLVLFAVRAESYSLFTIELLHKPLTTFSISSQQAQANSSFKLSLAPFINIITPEINYRITMNPMLRQDDYVALPVQLTEPPSGFTRAYDGEGVCPEQINLYTHQSCILRFYVDKNHYIYSGTTLGKDRQIIYGKSDGPYVHIADLFGSRATHDQNFNSALRHLAEPTQLQVTPMAQDGLEYNPSTLSIVGRPTRTGVYHFTISATNGNETTAPKDVEINVDINPHDKPVFKRHYSLASAMPEHNYRLNLMELIEPRPGFAVTNQVRFRIDLDHQHPSWLSLDKEKSTFLQGQAPSSDAGKIKEVTLIATSNTGGDSLPMTIQIPVAFDLEKKPVINKDIKIQGSAGYDIHHDFRANITDPTTDGSLKLILDRVEPAAPWLSVSAANPLELNGVVPQNAVGQLYQLTFHANTAIGGNSDPVTIPLQITINKSKTPRFDSDKPQLPMFYPGQPYYYNFVVCNDVYPAYDDIPYTVEFAKEYNNPEWLRIENNTLIADRVPDDLEKTQPMIFIVIKNTPGGKSNVLPVSLFIMQ